MYSVSISVSLTCVCSRYRHVRPGSVSVLPGAFHHRLYHRRRQAHRTEQFHHGRGEGAERGPAVGIGGMESDKVDFEENVRNLADLDFHFGPISIWANFDLGQFRRFGSSRQESF